MKKNRNRLRIQKQKTSQLWTGVLTMPSRSDNETSEVKQGALTGKLLWHPATSLIVNTDAEIIWGYTGEQMDLIIPDIIMGFRVRTIGDYAFQNMKYLIRLTISSNVTSINKFAFYHCINLTNVIIQNGVKNIDDEAFSFCTNLSNMILPDSVTYIGEYAFRGCKNLRIYSSRGSYAANYAKSHGILFYVL